MKKILFVSAFLVFANSVQAASVTSTSGTFSNNQTVTIRGSGFGVKSPVAPWLYDDFESQASGTIVRTHTPEVGTATYSAFPNGASDATVSHYSNTRAWNGGQAAFGHNATNDQSIAHDNFWVGGQATQNRFVSYVWYWTGVGSGVWKVDRMTSGIGGNPPYDACPNQGWGNSEGAYWNDCSSFTDIWEDIDDMISLYTPKNAWHRVDHWLSTGTKGLADGRWAMRVDRVNLFDRTLMICNNNANNCRFDTWVSPMLTLDGTSVTDVWVDHLYIDNTQMRVEIGDNPTWATCTKQVVQVPQNTWSDGQVQIKVKQGDLSSGTSYLFIVNSTGAVIDLNGGSTGQGYPITISSGGSCTPSCSGKSCGDNGCGGSCGTCSGGQNCVNYQCVTPSCTPSWQCSSWSACANNSQTRTCTDSNNCGVTTGRPAVTQSCTNPAKTADLNGDKKVNIFDYTLFLSSFGQTGSNVADLNSDNKVDIFDYTLFTADFGKNF